MKKIMATIFILFLFNIRSEVLNNQRLSMSLGSANTQSDNTTLLSFHYAYFLTRPYTLTLGKGYLNYGFGMRYTHASSAKFFLDNERSEYLNDLSVHLFNFPLFVEYSQEKWSVGANLDIFGITLGSDSVISGTRRRTAPEFLNIFLLGAFDKGSLNSEFWVGYTHQKFLYRIGLAHFLTTYKGSEERDKFINALFISVALNF